MQDLPIGIFVRHNQNAAAGLRTLQDDVACVINLRLRCRPLDAAILVLDRRALVVLWKHSSRLPSFLGRRIALTRWQRSFPRKAHEADGPRWAEGESEWRRDGGWYGQDVCR